jgi:uncharacterized membrane protein
VFFYGFIKKKSPAKKIDYSLLTKREAMIIKLVKKKKRITQKMLEKELSIPKSAISRNVKSLVKKELITKQKKGMTNVLMLKQ